MSNYWKTPGVPHKGWILENVIDIRADGQSAEETEYETCMMCNNERIRFVYIISHKDFRKKLKVGCVCAEKMTNDYINPRNNEKKLKNRAQRLIAWLKKDWRKSKKGNLFLKVKGHFILIYKDPKTKKFKCKIDEQYGKKQFETIELAKVAAFNGIEYYKKNNNW